MKLTELFTSLPISVDPFVGKMYAQPSANPAAKLYVVPDRPPRPLREATEDEARVLHVCYAWSQGVSRPLPADLVHLYRMMRPVHDLPKRPGT